MDDRSTYKMIINNQDVELCAKTLQISNRRMKKLLRSLHQTQREHGALRFYWADLIMLNILTTKIIKNANSHEIEALLKPIDRNEGGYYEK